MTSSVSPGRRTAPFRSAARVLLPVLALPLALAACGPAGDDASAPGSAEPRSAEPGPPELGPADGHDLPGVDLDRIQVGQEAPDFSLASYGGDVVTLSDFRGESSVLLVFYRGHW